MIGMAAVVSAFPTEWASRVWAAATPAPKVPNADSVTPGVWGFVITFLVAAVTVLLIIDMTRRIRRTRYRAEIAAKLDAEAREAEARKSSDH
jgi:TRAP-type C4-dicarboxylate transport system permease small subunit